jgi:hypothetical protein
MSPVLKVPRQCSLALLVEVMRMIGINFYMTLERLHYGEMLTLRMGGLHVKQAVQIGIWVHNSAFVLGPSKTTENLNRVGISPCICAVALF